MGEQFTNGGLPDKEWYELEEVAERWSKMTGSEVSVKDILHYAEIKLLDVCMKLAPVVVTIKSHPLNEEGMVIGKLFSHRLHCLWHETFVALLPLKNFDIVQLLIMGYMEFNSEPIKKLYNSGHLAIDIKNRKVSKEFIPPSFGPFSVHSAHIEIEKDIALSSFV